MKYSQLTLELKLCYNLELHQQKIISFHHFERFMKELLTETENEERRLSLQRPVSTLCTILSSGKHAVFILGFH